MVTKLVAVRAVNFSIGPVCTEFRCEHLCDDEVLGSGSEKRHRDMNTEVVTKLAAVRAVNLSIGPFCTEFRPECFCDDDAFWDLDQLLGPQT